MRALVLTTPGQTTPGDRADRAAAAAALGRRLAEVAADPETLQSETDRGLREMARPEDLAAVRRVAPGIDPVVGASFFLVQRTGSAFVRATRRDSPSNLLLACDRWFALPMLEARWLAMVVLERLVVTDPERTWQLLRRASKEATDWITIDALAHPFGHGILAEPFRWSEIGQLAFAPSSWERRLVGSTIATIPFIDRMAGRVPAIAEQALPILDSLIGDDRPEVQKALSWALRSLTLVDPDAVLDFCRREAAKAADERDGHRAWVIRDALAKLPSDDAARLRERLAGVRRRPGVPSTSEAAAVADAFVGSAGVPPLGGPHVARIPIEVP
jgi:3-methyladenine DNA glycosylase AlkD